METVVSGRVFYNGALRSLAIGVEEGVVVEVRRSLRGERLLDFGDRVILPGAVDAHVHMREPGLTHKEDFFTGTLAAACGGVTTVLDMPNTIPPTTSLDRLRDKAALASRRACVDFGLFAGLSAGGRPEEMAPFAVGYKLYMASTTGDLFIEDYSLLPSLLRRLEGTGRPVAVHAEDQGIVASTGPASGGLAAHNEARPPGAETGAVRRFLEASGSVLGHICHVSARGTLELLGRGTSVDGAAGVGEGGAAAGPAGAGAVGGGGRRVTCEVTPHHLLLDPGDNAGLGALAKTNPPVRPREEREALWRALLGGGVDILASDHAPHLEEEKDTAFQDAPPGVPGTETMVPLMMALVKRGRVPLELLVGAVCSGPAEVFGLRAGRIEPGAPASFAVYEPTSASLIRGKRLHSKCGWSPYEGMEAVFPRFVFLRGEALVEDWEPVASPGAGAFVTGEAGRGNRNHQ
ncbi:MAG: dihydroorotase [Thermoplasmatota archaeon]